MNLFFSSQKIKNNPLQKDRFTGQKNFFQKYSDFKEQM